MTEPRRVRAGDLERQQVADALAEHYTAGRLSTGEYDDRVAQAFAATYTDEFSPLFTDLPSGPMNRSKADPFAVGPQGGSHDRWGGHDSRSDSDYRRSGPFGREAPWKNRGTRGFAGRGSDGPPVAAIIVGAVLLFVVAGVLLAVARALLPLLVIGVLIYFFSQRRGGPPRSRRTSGPNGTRRW